MAIKFHLKLDSISSDRQFEIVRRYVVVQYIRVYYTCIHQVFEAAIRFLCVVHVLVIQILY